ncbi:glycosyltransferase [Salidesulfovibrio brasiliensis]|uniref:glycosyltransferase n=1 Tax=Salidesulfovibrio brasiliensis TaxID=221711 RepID=UPI0009FAF39F|nr:glycosyltransferase [Salidesulfovibrio brasiliensis]
MRILYLTNFYPPTVFGGYELRCADVVEGLAARGHEAIVVTSRHGSGVRSVEGHVHRVLRSFWDLPEKPADQPGYLWALLEDNLVLERLVRSFRPDVISVWNMLGLSYTLARSVQESGVPALFHVDDTWLLREDEYWGHYGNPGPGTVKQTLGPELAGLVRKGRPRDHHPDCVFISGYRRDNHVDAGMAQQDAPVVYGGIEPDRFDTGGARPDGSSDTLRLLFAGAWTEAKGAEIPIRAMGLLPEAVRSRVRVTYVGKGPAGAHAGLETLAAALGIQDSVIFQGPVERDAMPGVYAAHDAFLFTASGPEGFRWCFWKPWPRALRWSPLRTAATANTSGTATTRLWCPRTILRRLPSASRPCLTTRRRPRPWLRRGASSCVSGSRWKPCSTAPKRCSKRPPEEAADEGSL